MQYSKTGIDLCGSPLEVKMARAFAKYPEADFRWRKYNEYPQLIGRWPKWFLALGVQVELKPYRVDFAIVSAGFAVDSSAPSPLLIIVEVDGHDYHERTKEQAEHDKKRDRFMMVNGAKVFRFTGREVFRNDMICVDEVLQYTFGMQRQYLYKETHNIITNSNGILSKNTIQNILSLGDCDWKKELIDMMVFNGISEKTIRGGLSDKEFESFLNEETAGVMWYPEQLEHYQKNKHESKVKTVTYKKTVGSKPKNKTKSKPKKWAMKHDACIKCGTTEHKHTSRGFCKICMAKNIKYRDRKKRTWQRLFDKYLDGKVYTVEWGNTEWGWRKGGFHQEYSVCGRYGGGGWRPRTNPQTSDGVAT